MLRHLFCCQTVIIPPSGPEIKYYGIVAEKTASELFFIPPNLNLLIFILQLCNPKKQIYAINFQKG